MNVIIYGFETIISVHSLKDICFFLLVYAVMLVLVGRMIEKQTVKLQYMQLLRFQSYRRWWHQIWVKMVALAMAMVGIMFVGIGFFNIIFQRNDFRDGVIWPLVLWCIHMCAVSSFLALMGSFARGFFISFFVIIGVQVFSMYGGLYLGNVTNYLPGSYIMVRRTTGMDGTMPIGLLLFIEIMCIVVIGVFGYRLYRRGSR